MHAVLLGLMMVSSASAAPEGHLDFPIPAEMKVVASLGLMQYVAAFDCSQAGDDRYDMVAERAAFRAILDQAGAPDPDASLAELDGMPADDRAAMLTAAALFGIETCGDHNPLGQIGGTR